MSVSTSSTVPMDNPYLRARSHYKKTNSSFTFLQLDQTYVKCSGRYCCSTRFDSAQPCAVSEEPDSSTSVVTPQTMTDEYESHDSNCSYSMSPLYISIRCFKWMFRLFLVLMDWRRRFEGCEMMATAMRTRLRIKWEAEDGESSEEEEGLPDPNTDDGDEEDVPQASPKQEQGVPPTQLETTPQQANANARPQPYTGLQVLPPKTYRLS
ncbi:hypothetical protein PM082_008772 [Marasmius tenuissimus]|nr:hypothetical protein PM082_008772 [Marasmius tenuissimus]